MDNMKPLIDAVSEDTREEAATDNEAGRLDCRGARQGGQRGSSCGRHGRSGPPLWAGMMSHMGPPYGPSLGPSCGPSWGPLYGPPFVNGPNPVGSPECLYDVRKAFMYGPSGCGPMRCYCGRRPQPVHGWSAFGPMTGPWGVRPPWADETVDTESDEEHAGKDNGADEAAQVSRDTHRQQDGARVTSEEEAGQQCPSCPLVDRMRHRRKRHANVDCRIQDPCPLYRRCRRGFGARSHCPPWLSVPGDCCQSGAPMGWGECSYPPPFFRQFACDSAVESNSDTEHDNQKQDDGKQTPEAFCPFSRRPSGFGDRLNPYCHGSRRGWQCGPSRNKLYHMLLWKRKVLKGKLQRIQSHLECLQPSEDEKKEAPMGEDGSPEQASSMSTAPEAASQMYTQSHTRTEREWEVIADSE